MIDPRLEADIRTAESCRLTAYRDTENLWTIGWGHLLDQTPDWTNYTISQTLADTWLDADIGIAQKTAQALPEWAYLNTPCRQNAVIELCFEMGHRWLSFVNTRAAIRAQNWQAAHDGLLASLWASEVHADRADRLADYLLTGQYQGTSE
jgi:lysozyme